MITSTSFVLAVPSLDVSCAFYRDVLGFEVREMDDDGWRLLVNGACRIMVGACPDAISPRNLGDHSYFGYLVRDDVDEFYARVVASGAEIVKPLLDEPWGMREFGVRTVDGHRIMVGQEISEVNAGGVTVVDLNYVSLYIHRFDEAVAFYSRVFGPPAYVESELRGWNMGATWLTVFRGADGPGGNADPRNIEFAVQVASPAEVDRLVARLVDAGARVFSAPRDTRMYEPMRFACVDDPFGVRVDVYCTLSTGPTPFAMP